jgi:hypothetical protein
MEIEEGNEQQKFLVYNKLNLDINIIKSDSFNNK